MAQIPTPHIARNRAILLGRCSCRRPCAQNTSRRHSLRRSAVNNVRGIHGYTGFYEGKRVSVMASGMGMPSIGIYSYELYNFYGVENIIRVGSAGAMSPGLKLRDVVAGMSAYTNSAFGDQYGFRGTLAPACSYGLLTAAMGAAEKAGIHLVPGPIFSSDTFYDGGSRGDARSS